MDVNITEDIAVSGIACSTTSVDKQTPIPQKLASWEDIDIAFAMFYEFLASVDHLVSTETLNTETPNTETLNPKVYYVVFSFGTVLCIDNDIVPAAGDSNNCIIDDHKLTPEYMESWPVDRLKDMTADEVYANALATYNLQTYLDGVDGSAIRIAFDTIIQNGYPSTFLQPDITNLGRSLFSVDFSDDIDVLSLVIDDDAYMDADINHDINHITTNIINTAISLRQLDYMFPEVYAVITPTLGITKFV